MTSAPPQPDSTGGGFSATQGDTRQGACPPAEARRQAKSQAEMALSSQLSSAQVEGATWSCGAGPGARPVL